MKTLQLICLSCLLSLSISILFTSCGEDDIEGCTNVNADNYNSAATLDDGSCVISGCSDPDAENYNPNANSGTNADCIFARDKFLGSFLGSIDCSVVTQFNGDTTTVVFEPDDTDINRLIVSLVAEDFTLPIQATVDGNDILMTAEDFPFQVDILGISTEVLLDITGEASINDAEDTINGDFTATIKNSNTGAEILNDGCRIEATRI